MFWIVGFKTPFAAVTPVSSIDMGSVTHIAHVGLNPNADGTVTSIRETGTATTLIAAAHASGVKVLLNIQPSSNMASAVTNHLSTFIDNIMNIVNADGYDGVDVDWEIGGSLALYQSFFPALRTALGSSKLIMVDALPMQFELIQIESYVDRIFVMTYDLSDSYSTAWFNNATNGLWTGYGGDAPGVISSIEGAIDVWQHHTTPAATLSKLGMGIAFYGWKSTGGSPTITAPRQASSNNSTKTQLNYNDMINSGLNLSSATLDSEAGNKWIALSSPSGWLDYNDTTAVAAKARYIYTAGCGGLIYWNIESDYLSGQTPSHPLMAAIKAELFSLQATIAGTSTVKASLLDNRFLSATIPGQSTVQANLKATGALTATVAGTGVLTGRFAPTSLLENIVSFWELEETSGSRIDQLGVNLLTDVSTVTQSTGKIGNCAQFTKANTEYLFHYDSGLNAGPDLTISAWVYADSLGSTPLAIAARHSFTSADNSFLLYARDTGLGFSFEIYDGQGNSQRASGLTPSVSTWYHVVATYTSSDKIARLYINDGTVNASSALTAGINTTGTAGFGIGGTATGNFPFDGRIDQLGIWHRVLSASEITQLYNGGSGLSYANMAGLGQAAAVISGTSTVTAQPKGTGALISTIAGNSQSTLNLKGTGALRSTITATSTIKLNLGSLAFIQSTIPGVASTIANLTLIPNLMPMSAFIAGAATLKADLLNLDGHRKPYYKWNSKTVVMRDASILPGVSHEILAGHKHPLYD